MFCFVFEAFFFFFFFVGVCRKKRKWDQPAESLVPVGMAVPGVIPLSNAASLGGIAYPGVTPVVSGAVLRNPMVASVQQHTAATAVQKSNQVRYLIILQIYNQMHFPTKKKKNQIKLMHRHLVVLREGSS